MKSDKRKRITSCHTAQVVGVSLLFAFLSFSCSERIPAPEIGKPIPEFALPDLQGEIFQMSQTRGRVVLVNFWASWCPPCVDEMPSLEKLYQTLGDKGLDVVAISVDDSLDIIEQFRDEYDLSFTILHDKGRKVSHHFQTFMYPETYIVDREGRLVEKIVGPLDWIGPTSILDIVGLLKSGNSSVQMQR